MAKYGKTSQRKVKKAMHEYKSGKLKSGRSGKKVKSRKQAIAIGFICLATANLAAMYLAPSQTPAMRLFSAAGAAQLRVDRFERIGGNAKVQGREIDG